MKRIWRRPEECESVFISAIDSGLPGKITELSGSRNTISIHIIDVKMSKQHDEFIIVASRIRIHFRNYPKQSGFYDQLISTESKNPQSVNCNECKNICCRCKNY